MPDLEADSLAAFERLAHVKPEKYFMSSAATKILSVFIKNAILRRVVYAQAPMILEPEALAWISSTLSSEQSVLLR